MLPYRRGAGRWLPSPRSRRALSGPAAVCPWGGVPEEKGRAFAVARLTSASLGGWEQVVKSFRPANCQHQKLARKLASCCQLMPIPDHAVVLSEKAHQAKALIGFIISVSWKPAPMASRGQCTPGFYSAARYRADSVSPRAGPAQRLSCYGKTAEQSPGSPGQSATGRTAAVIADC